MKWSLFNWINVYKLCRFDAYLKKRNEFFKSHSFEYFILESHCPSFILTALGLSSFNIEMLLFFLDPYENNIIIEQTKQTLPNITTSQPSIRRNSGGTIKTKIELAWEKSLQIWCLDNRKSKQSENDHSDMDATIPWTMDGMCVCGRQ